MYPALAVAEAMTARYPELELFFVGTVGGFERPLLREANVQFAAHDEVQAGPVHGVNPLRALVSGVKLVVGTAQAVGLLRRYKPQVILSTGGWVGLPVALAAWMRRIPLLIFLPDIEPGLTIKALRPFARRVALTVDQSAAFFKPEKTVVTGYALRQSMLDVAARVNRDGETARQEARTHFGLDPLRRTLLVFGGSRGARAINMALIDQLPQLLAMGLQVLHITGTLDWERAQMQVKTLTGIPNGVPNHEHYHAHPYLHEDMGLALAAADLVICRAGASVLGEFPLFGLPSILIPLAYSWHYQQVNADYLAGRGAALHLPEEHMSADLVAAVGSILDDPRRLAQMRDSARALARPDGALNVGRELAQLAGEGG